MGGCSVGYEIGLGGSSWVKRELEGITALWMGGRGVEGWDSQAAQSRIWRYEQSTGIISFQFESESYMSVTGNIDLLISHL
jgi:hypothetical protein